MPCPRQERRRLTVLQNQSLRLPGVDLFLGKIDNGDIGTFHSEHDGCCAPNSRISTLVIQAISKSANDPKPIPNTPCNDSLLSNKFASSLVKLVTILTFLLQGDGVLAHLVLDTDGLALISLGMDGESIGTGEGTVVGRGVGRGLSLKGARSESGGITFKR